MDRLERLTDPTLNLDQVLRQLIASVQSRIWTALPAVVKSFNAPAMTVHAQLALNGQYTDKFGVPQRLAMPVVLDCPVGWPGGGGCTFTWTPIAGDECLILFASRCIDSWFAQGYQPPVNAPAHPGNDPPEIRMHNLSDGFALPGVRNAKRAFIPVAGGAQLQTDDGTAYIQLNPTTKAVNIVAATVNITTTGDVNINGSTISSSGEITDNSVASGVTLAQHKHAGVQAGGASTAVPTPGT